MNLHTDTPSDGDAKKLHALMERTVRHQAEHEWRALLVREIESDFAELTPQILEGQSWFAS